MLVEAGLPLAAHWKLYLPVVLVSFAIMVPPILHADRRDQAVDRLRGWMAYDAELIGALQADGRVARGLDVAAATTRLVATLNGAGMLWMLGVIDPVSYADVLNHAIDDELGLS